MSPLRNSERRNRRPFRLTAFTFFGWGGHTSGRGWLQRSYLLVPAGGAERELASPAAHPSFLLLV